MLNSREEVFSHKHIVLCGDNFNALSLIRSLGEVGIYPIVIVAQEGHVPLIEKSKFISIIHQTDSIEESFKVLLTYGDDNLKPFIYTSDDNHQSFLDKNYDVLKDRFFFFNCGESGRVTHLMNKAVLCDLAEECGFHVPSRELVDRGTLPHNISYPVYTKTLTPYQYGWKLDAGIYNTPEELSEAYGHMVSEQFLLQEYIKKKDELEIHGFSINGGESVFFSFCSLYFRMSDTAFGFYKYYQLFQDDDLEEKILKIIRKARYTGIFEVEFLVDEKDERWFLEVNFRFPLSNYACTYGGDNLPFLWAKSMISGQIEGAEAVRKHERFTFMNEVSDFMTSVVGKELSFRTWFKDFWNCDCLVLYHKNDTRPFYFYIWNRLKSTVQKRIHRRRS